MERIGNNLEAGALRWKRSKDRGDNYRAGRVADEICEALAPLIAKLSRPHLERDKSIERTEIENVGKIAILGALDRYEPVTGGASFKTFAYTTISGILNHFVRDEHGGNIHEPARLRDNRRKVRQAEGQLLAEGRSITPEALAEESGLDLKQIRAVLDSDAVMTPTTSFDLDPEAVLFGTAGTDWLPAVETRLALEKPLSHLPADLLVVIEKRFFEEKTLEETGQELGITREAVRQRELKALARLRRVMEHSDPLDSPAPAINRQLTEANIARLGEPHRTVLQGYYQEARTHREIGEQLGLTSDTVCDIRRRGLETLQHLLTS